MVSEKKKVTLEWVGRWGWGGVMLWKYLCFTKDGSLLSYHYYSGDIYHSLFLEMCEYIFHQIVFCLVGAQLTIYKFNSLCV